MSKIKKTVQIDFYCTRCKKKLKGNVFLDIPDELFDENERKRISDHLLHLHNDQEHTKCAQCGKKIRVGIDPKESWHTHIVGKSYDKPKGAGDTGLRIWFGIFCSKCIEELDKEKAKN